MENGKAYAWAWARKNGSTRHFVTGKRPKKGPRTEVFQQDHVGRLHGAGPGAISKLEQLGITTVAQLIENPDAPVAAAVHAAARNASPGAYICNELDHRRNPNEANPYKSRYGDQWETVIDNTAHMRKYVCITTVWEAVMASTIKAFRGTPHESDFLIYHDALSLLKAKSTIEWLKKQKHGERSYWDIWIHPMNGLNAGTMYSESPTGNSPELMPLDCSLFSDLVRSLRLHTRLTSKLPKEHEKKFSMATPKMVSRAVHRLWDPSTGGVPCSHRIIQDVERCFHNHVRQIIEAQGAMVAGIGSRNGHRKRRLGQWGGNRTKGAAPKMPWVHTDAKAPSEEQTNKSVRCALDDMLKFGAMVERFSALHFEEQPLAHAEK